MNKGISIQLLTAIWCEIGWLPRHLRFGCAVLMSLSSLQGMDDARIQIKDNYFTDIPAYSAAGEAAQVEGIKAIYFEGPEYQGRSSRIFAYYGHPEVRPGEKVPGVILLHGGGGTAFPEWVQRWVSQGYAAIAIDTVGCVPVSETVRNPIPDGGPTCGPDFEHLDDPVSDQWPYYVENAIARARTLLGSFPEVDDKRIGITGISWGGYLSSIAAAIDKRYLFAVHVYGCGFLKDKSWWMEQLNQPGKERWSEMFDPSQYLAETRTPTLWVSGTNDHAFPIESLVKSHRLVTKAPSWLCVRIGMPHGHPEGWSPPEIRAFADSYCLEAPPLPQVTEQGQSKDRKAWITYKSSTPIVSAQLIFAKRSDAAWKDRVWESLPAQIEAGSHKISASIPENVMFYYFNIYDDRNLLSSSAVSEIANGQ